MNSNGLNFKYFKITINQAEINFKNKLENWREKKEKVPNDAKPLL